MLNKKTELSFKMQRRCTCKGYLLSSLATCQTTTELLSRTSMLVPTDVTNQIIPPKEDWERNFKCHVPNVR